MLSLNKRLFTIMCFHSNNIPLRSRKTIALCTKRLPCNEAVLCTKKLVIVQKSDRDGKIRDEKFYNKPVFPNQICNVKIHTDSFSLPRFNITNYDIFTSLCLDVYHRPFEKIFSFLCTQISQSKRYWSSKEFNINPRSAIT